MLRLGINSQSKLYSYTFVSIETYFCILVNKALDVRIGYLSYHYQGEDYYLSPYP
jgi:hypothetical protein